LVELAQVREGTKVLDVATGRGAILFPAAEAVGLQGHVIGIDISDSMVQETAAQIEILELPHAEVCCMDAETLLFEDDSFDYVLCGLSIFFFPQFDQALSEMRRVLKSGGTIGVTTFWRDDERWKWMGELFKKYLPPVPEEKSDAEEEETTGPDFNSHNGMEAVMRTAGFENIKIVGEEPDFIYSNEEAWWSTM